MSRFDLKDSENLCDLIEDAGFDPRRYSDRAMHGKQCVSVTLGEQTPFEFVGELVSQNETRAMYADEGENEGISFELLGEMISTIQTDSMGLGSVVYFPEVPWPNDARFASSQHRAESGS